MICVIESSVNVKCGSSGAAAAGEHRFSAVSVCTSNWRRYRHIASCQFCGGIFRELVKAIIRKTRHGFNGCQLQGQICVFTFDHDAACTPNPGGDMILGEAIDQGVTGVAGEVNAGQIIGKFNTSNYDPDQIDIGPDHIDSGPDHLDSKPSEKLPKRKKAIMGWPLLLCSGGYRDLPTDPTPHGVVQR